jgi:hypothetical protein
MARQPGYKQVSITTEAHRALRQMSYFMAASVAEKVTLSQVILIAHKMMYRHDMEIVGIAGEIGIEPAEPESSPSFT